jgi:hypothetical protein
MILDPLIAAAGATRAHHARLVILFARAAALAHDATRFAAVWRIRVGASGSTAMLPWVRAAD